jgi:hypothetical protein
MDSSARARAEWQLSKLLRARAFRMTDVESGDLLLLSKKQLSALPALQDRLSAGKLPT